MHQSPLLNHEEEWVRLSERRMALNGGGGNRSRKGWIRPPCVGVVDAWSHLQANHFLRHVDVYSFIWRSHKEQPAA